mgnify:CR=1 FL=1
MVILFPAIIMSIETEDDREFMMELYIKHYITMYRMAYSLTGNLPDTEDVVQDTCEALIKKISHLRTLDCNVLVGYIVSTVKNTAFSLHRKRQGHKFDMIAEKAEELADLGPGPEEKVLEEASLEELMMAIEKLSEPDQAVLRAKYFEQRTDGEIAELLGIQANSVRSRLMRARNRLKNMIKEADEHGKSR